MKNIIITGGASGMGKATALLLESKGYKVYLLDIIEPKLEKENIVEIVCDVTNTDSIQTAFEKVSSLEKEINAIIHFAGIIMMNSLIEISESDFKRIYDINLFGVFRVNKTFFPLLNRQNGKIIITTSELAANSVLPFNAIYSITKKALDAYAEGLRMELGLLGIKVVTLRPGAISTPLINSSSNALDKLVENTILYKGKTGRFKKIVDAQQGGTIPPERIASLVLKILQKKNPKFIYTKNANIKLKLLNLVPSKLQLTIFKAILK